MSRRRVYGGDPNNPRELPPLDPEDARAMFDEEFAYIKHKEKLWGIGPPNPFKKLMGLQAIINSDADFFNHIWNSQ